MKIWPPYRCHLREIMWRNNKDTESCRMSSIDLCLPRLGASLVRKDMRTPITVIIWQWLHRHPPTRTTQLNLSGIANSWTSWQIIGFCLCFKPLCFWTICYTAIVTKTCTNYYRKKWKNKTLKTSESYPTTCIRCSF